MTGIRRNAYIYPAGDMLNSYLNHFIHAVEPQFVFLNKDKPSKYGLFDVIKYVNRLDILFLNWPEEVPERRGGTFQAFFYILMIFWLKFRKTAICWTFHNKVSHVQGKTGLKNFLRYFTARNADFIITHAKEGISLVEKLAQPGYPKIKFFHHPVLPAINLKPYDEKKYDLIMWGMVTPYKGVDEFLTFIEHEHLDHLKILIAGKIGGNAYRDKVLAHRSNTITILDRFIPVDELEMYISQSRAVLFTYLENSILSSGALMDTLRYAPLVIGPACGAFNDLKEEGLILTYNDYAHLKVLLTDELRFKPDVNKIQQFITENSWENFGKSLGEFIYINSK